MKVCIGVMGASLIPSPEVADLAYQTGKAIALTGSVLITGATNGLPLQAARGAAENQGEVIGFSPAINAMDHERLGLPFLYHDLIHYTGMGSHGRNLLNVRASDALVFIGGSMGALNEFTIAYDEHKIIGILEGSGGFCNHMRDWLQYIGKLQNRALLHYSNDPERIVENVLSSVHGRYSKMDRDVP